MFEGARAAFIKAESVPAVERSAVPRPLYPGIKRFTDIVFTLAIAPLAIPLVGLLALFVRLDGHPAFYGQRRLGKDGREFTLWKLRTMVPNAEKQLEAYLEQNPAARAEWDSAQKLRQDPRITKIGRFLRKYSLDEVPQFWNVLIGEMSVVGPRPMSPEQRPQYPGTAYFELRPGLTGLWQVSVRNGCSFAERAVHDTRYANRMSLMTDAQIMLMTVVVVARGTGL